MALFIRKKLEFSPFFANKSRVMTLFAYFFAKYPHVVYVDKLKCKKGGIK